MKAIYTFLIFFIAFIMQTTIINILEIYEVTPNLILCLVVVFGFLYDKVDTFIWAILFGLLQDIYFAQIVGTGAISYFLIALLVYFVKDYVNPENMISAIGLIIGCTFLYYFLYFGISKIFGSTIHIISVLEIQPVLIIYNIIVTIILYKIFLRKVIKHRSDRKFKGRFISYE